MFFFDDGDVSRLHKIILKTLIIILKDLKDFKDFKDFIIILLIMKLLIIGSNGQLGRDFVKQSEIAGYAAFPVDYPQIDIRDEKSVFLCATDVKPDVIINCAAFTAVDECEVKPETAFELNADACHALANAANAYNATLVHYSTDYVFDGTAQSPYTEEDAANPQSVYGKSKLRGEEIIAAHCADSMIFRIAWLYGAHGNNFVKTIRKLLAVSAPDKKPLNIVNDQFGSPTWTVSVCRQTLAMLKKQERGVFHCTSEGACSWFDFANEIAAALGVNAAINPCTTEEFPRPAPRPRNSVLENARLKALGANIMPHWRNGFKEFLSEEANI